MFAALSLQGGGIVALKRGDQALMVPARTAPFLGSFTMVPFCSRITAGRFDYRGKSVQLAPNFPPEPHTIHGFGWQSRWQIGHLEQNACTLVYEHDSCAAATTGWPWTFTVEQHFALSETELSHSVRVENISEETMPVGAGFHPYFPLTPSCDISMLCRDELVLDADGLPITASGAPNNPADNNAPHTNPLASRPWLQRGLDRFMSGDRAVPRFAGLMKPGPWPLNRIRHCPTGWFMPRAKRVSFVSNPSAIYRMP